MRHHAWLISYFLADIGFLYVGQAGLKLPTSDGPPASDSQSAGITGMSHCAQPSQGFYRITIFVWKEHYTLPLTVSGNSHRCLLSSEIR
ncbi:hypothetical protein AAY473_038035 [Plecturocebus cupreus]